jgi:hypothetical protein
MNVHVPQHLTADWIGRELSRRHGARASGRSTKTTYLRPKSLSIREHIALAEKLKQL